jgi:uncharacterized damage-inducible protein DinB
MDNILPWAMPLIESTPERWQRLAQTIPDDLLRQPPAPGQWSAMDCLHHLVAIEGVFASRLEAFLTGQQSFPAYDPDAPENRPDPAITAGELAAEFARRRTDSLLKLRELTDTDLQRRSVHAQLGPVTLDHMVHEWAAHDLNHTVQAERALMQPFIRGCGPWQEYFVDHAITA